jgi:lipopolysaccharide export system protein LptA
MKTFLLSVAVASSTVFASAQTAVAPTAMVYANDIVQTQHIQFSGSVRIQIGTAIITADEADAGTTGPNGPTEFDLRGNVHLRSNPSK